MPVLPLDGSIRVAPGARRPDFSASSTIALAMRSLTLPVGLWLSSLAHRRTPGPDENFGKPTSGVLPIASTRSSYRMAYPPFTGGLPLGSASRPGAWAGASLSSPPDPRFTGGLPLGVAWRPGAWAGASLSSPPDPRFTGGLPLGVAWRTGAWAGASLSSPPDPPDPPATAGRIATPSPSSSLASRVP